MNKRRYLLLATCLATALVILVPPVAAQTGGDYAITWSTIDGGGTTSATGHTWTLAGTTGQPDANRLAGGTYVLYGGFWPGGAAAAAGHTVYLPLVIRG